MPPLAPSRIAEMTLRNLPSQQVVCKLTVTNPSDRPVLLQPLLLDALLPGEVDVDEMDLALKKLIPDFVKLMDSPFESNHYLSQVGPPPLSVTPKCFHEPRVIRSACHFPSHDSVYMPVVTEYAPCDLSDIIRANIRKRRHTPYGDGYNRGMAHFHPIHFS
ncbi:unnamed protein product [Dibothriocephalus latus]|uniref:Uncharacterized protein n=1 Tax=Dibothriocephalus latus TaxID=60516 RepID=A0A3P6R961_DIBLA|nr:unnamed protein product [Dibothriocephalus latus]